MNLFILILFRSKLRRNTERMANHFAPKACQRQIRSSRKRGKNKQTNRQTDIQINKQTNRQTCQLKLLVQITTLFLDFSHLYN